MSDLIDRHAAIRWVKTECNPYGKPTLDFESGKKVIEHLEQMPSAQLAQDLTNGCTDTISRASVVDAIDGVDWYHQNENGEMVHGANSAEDQPWYKAEDIYAAIDSVPSAQPVEDVRAMCGECDAWNQYKNYPQPGWIPCSEQMPKEKDAGILKKLGTNRLSDYVIATVEVKGERMTVIIRTHDGVWHWDKKYAFPDYKVVAWMPLPKPWEGGQDG